MNIPFVDLAAQYKNLRDEIDPAVRRVLEKGQYVLGSEVEAFERELAAYCGAGHCVAVASGTEAVQLALMAAGIRPGDEVLTTALTAVATLAAIELAGGRPVLVDIDPACCCLDPRKVEAARSVRSRAIVPVHLYGCPADLAPLIQLAHEHHLVMVEDCAQAHGARYRSRPVGSWGDLGAFSFYPTKNLGAYGDGGAVVTNNDSLAQRLRELRQYGWDPGRVSLSKGLNSRLDELQAAILRVKLAHLEEWNRRRQELAGLYRSGLEGIDLVLPEHPPEAEPVYHLFVVRHPRRDALRSFLADRGIQTNIHYPLPAHLQPAYHDLGYQQEDFPEAEKAAKQVLSLPLYPEMTDTMVDFVCQVIRAF